MKEELPPNQTILIGHKQKGRAEKRMERVVHNPLLISLRHLDGRRRHVHCISVDVLEKRIGVTFRDGRDRKRYFTEWFDRRYWHLITGDEQKAYYQKKEELKAIVKDEAYKERVKKREAREARRARREGYDTPEKLAAVQAARHDRRVEIAKEVLVRKPELPVEAPPAPTVEPTPPPVPEPADDSRLTPAEEAALSGQARATSDQRVGNLDEELPGEYNAKLHMKTDRFPFGDPDKLAIFDALVTGEAVKQEALRKLAQRRRTMQNRQAIERGESVWSSGE